MFDLGFGYRVECLESSHDTDPETEGEEFGYGDGECDEGQDLGIASADPSSGKPNHRDHKHRSHAPEVGDSLGPGLGEGENDSHQDDPDQTEDVGDAIGSQITDRSDQEDRERYGRQEEFHRDKE